MHCLIYLCIIPCALDFLLNSDVRLAKAFFVGLNFFLHKTYWEGPSTQYWLAPRPGEGVSTVMASRILYFCKAFQPTISIDQRALSASFRSSHLWSPSYFRRTELQSWGWVPFHRSLCHLCPPSFPAAELCPSSLLVMPCFPAHQSERLWLTSYKYIFLSFCPIK